MASRGPRRDGRYLLVLLGLGLVLPSLVVGCAGRQRPAGASIAETAELDYLEALEELSRGDFAEAAALFQQVAKAPRYVRWSALAQLRVGDALFFEGKYAEAAQQYVAFIAQNEGDPNIHHARYMMGRAYYEQVPTGWFLTPPAFENDRQALARCRNELRGFMRRYSRSRYLPEVREMLAEIEAMEYGFNDYVATYYETRKRPAGVVGRVEHMMSEWPSIAQSVPNFRRLAAAYEDLERYEDAARTLRRALERHPYGGHVAGMTRALERLESRVRQTEPRGDTPPEGSPVDEERDPLLLDAPRGTRLGDSPMEQSQ